MTYKIFTSGKMTGLPYEKQMGWRKQLEYKLNEISDKDITFIHPPLFFSVDEPSEIAREWEIKQLMDSDIVVIDLSTIKDSIGTHIELGIAETLSRTKTKPVYIVGVGEPNTDHSWITDGLLAYFCTVEEAAEFISDYLLI